MKLGGFFETPLLWSYRTPFNVGQVCLGSPEFSAELEEACVYQGEEGLSSSVGLQKGLGCDVGPEAQSGPLAVSLHIRPSVTFAFTVWWHG
jgi:hypothetical protein